MRHRLLAILVIALCVCGSRLSFADDGGEAGAHDGGEVEASTSDQSDDASAGNSEDSAAPLGCNGALCDTSNDATCTVAAGAVGRSGQDLGAFVIVLSGVLAGTVRRRARRTERSAREGAAADGRPDNQRGPRHARPVKGQAC